jgi:PKD repeat protein
MLRRLLTVAFMIVALAGLAQTSHAQYLYLDANGDGVWSTADRLNANGIATVVDAWINTNHNRDGSLALCDTGDGDIGFWNSYAMNLGAVNGTVSFTNFINQQPDFNIVCTGVGVDFLSNSTEMTACRATPQSRAAGLQRMFTVTITGQTGTPSIQYLALSSLGPNFSSFGTPCSGNDFDNTYKLGSDFQDNDGLLTGGTNINPSFNTAGGEPPATRNGAENSPVSVTARLTDADAGQQLTITQTNNAPFLTGPASVGPAASPVTLTLSGTPSFAQAGTYTINWTGRDNATPTNGTTTATTSVVIANTDRAPTVTAPATATFREGVAGSFTVSAADPDGDAINSLTAASSPATTGSTFTAGAGNTSGTFSWTPTFTQNGIYTVTFTATNALSGSAATVITFGGDRAPVVTAPAAVSGNEGTLITFTVTAADPDGQAITFLTAASSPATTGSTFTAGAGNTSGTFSWTPNNTQAGTYTVTFTASNALSGSAQTTITVNNSGQNPTVTAPASQTTSEGVLLTFGVSATDADGDHVTLTMLAGSPTGASFVDNGNNTGTFSWTPGFNQAGSYSVTFRGSDGNGGIANATTAITVNNVDRTPVADAGGPYAGITGFPVQFNGSGSSDPDGDALSYMWDFGDGGSSTEVGPMHTYALAGVYNVTLTVTSGGPALSDTDATTATITDTLPARGFALGGNTKTSLGAGKPFTCFQVEAVGGSFNNSQVLLPTVRMIYPVGSSSQIFANGAKTGIDGDKDGNGVTEITACFAKEDMRVLFAGLPAGNNTVTIEIKGDITGGGSFSATLEHVVKSNGSFLAASISPNPLNPRAKLSFSTTKPGAVRVQMFDPQGRLVKTIADEPVAMAGYHDYTIDGRSGSGTKLASGVYFVKVWSEHDGNEVQRITILK